MAKLLSFVLLTVSGTMAELQDPAFSLNLKIVACALKLHDFNRALAL